MNRKDFYFRQKVKASELDAAFTEVENAFASFLQGFNYVGIATGAEVAQHSPTNLTVVVSGPAIVYDQNQKHIQWFPNQVVNCALDENGAATAVPTVAFERWLSIFAEYDETLSDPRVDGNGDTVYFEKTESFKINVVQGAEAGSATRPPLRGDQILIADVKLIYGQTVIVDADIDTTRTQLVYVLTGSPHEINARSLQDALQSALNIINDASVADGISVEAIADSPHSISDGSAQEALEELLGHVNTEANILNGGPNTARVHILPAEMFQSDRGEGASAGWFYNAYGGAENEPGFWQSEAASPRGAMPITGIGSGSVLTAVKICVTPGGATPMQLAYKEASAHLIGTSFPFTNRNAPLSPSSSSGTAVQLLTQDLSGLSGGIVVDNTLWQYRLHVKGGQIGDKIWWFAAFFTDKGPRNY